MSRSDNNKNSIFDFAKTLLGQKPGGVCRVDERYDEYVIENSPTEEQLAAQRREDFFRNQRPPLERVGAFFCCIQAGLRALSLPHKLQHFLLLRICC